MAARVLVDVLIGSHVAAGAVLTGLKWLDGFSCGGFNHVLWRSDPLFAGPSQFFSVGEAATMPPAFFGRSAAARTILAGEGSRPIFLGGLRGEPQRFLERFP